jgi:hypothetical protein
MSYQLSYSDRAIGQIDELPDEFLDVVEQNLRALAVSPTSLSERIASPPFASRGQLFHFHALGVGGTSWFFTVIFCYSQDETALHILSITWRELIDE